MSLNLFFLVLEIARYELIITGKLTDITSTALSRLFAFQCFEYYYRDFPEIYTLTSDLHIELSKYNERFRNHDLTGEFDILAKGGISTYMELIIPVLITKKSE